MKFSIAVPTLSDGTVGAVPAEAITFAAATMTLNGWVVLCTLVPPALEVPDWTRADFTLIAHQLSQHEESSHARAMLRLAREQKKAPEEWTSGAANSPCG